MNHRHIKECFTARRGTLLVLRQPPVTVHLAKRPLDKPTLRLHHEANLTDQLADHLPQPAPLDPRPTQGRLESRIGPNDFHPLDHAVELGQQLLAPIPVLHTRRQHQQRPKQAQRVHRHEPLAAVDFFPRVHPAGAALLGRLHRRTVQDHRRRLGPFAGLAPDLLPEGVVDALPGAVLLPEAEVREDDAVGR